MKFLFSVCFITVSLTINAQIHKLEKLKGTWLIRFADNSKAGIIYQDSILTKLDWSADGKSLLGEQQIKTAEGGSYNHVIYTYNVHSKQFTYSENGGPNQPLIIDGNVWIYPAGTYRTLNTFNRSASEIVYEVQKMEGNQWRTIKKGSERKIKE